MDSDILNLINGYSEAKNKGNFCKNNINKSLSNKIFNLTSFLPYNSTISQRIWHLKNDILNIPLCKICGNSSKWATNRAKYNTYCSVKCSREDEDLISSIKETNRIKYGCESPFGNKNIQKKTKDTLIKKYGVDNVSKLQEVKNKKEVSSLKKYGTKNPSMNINIRDKIRIKNIERCYEDRKSTLLNLLDKEIIEYMYFKQYMSQKQIAKNLGVSDVTISNYMKYHSLNVRVQKNFSMKSIQWLLFIENKEKVKIQCATNMGEKNIHGRIFVDGYSEETKTVYEFYGDRFHGNLSIFEPEDKCHPYDNEITAIELYNATIERENTIKKQGYTIVSIWESDWDEFLRNNPSIMDIIKLE